MTERAVLMRRRQARRSGIVVVVRSFSSECVSAAAKTCRCRRRPMAACTRRSIDRQCPTGPRSPVARRRRRRRRRRRQRSCLINEIQANRARYDSLGSATRAARPGPARRGLDRGRPSAEAAGVVRRADEVYEK